MTFMRPNETHYFVFPHTVAGMTRTQFSVTVVKNGEKVTNIGVNLREIATKIYCASFVNDGTHLSQWSIVIQDPNYTDRAWQHNWRVEKPLTEKITQVIRSKQSAEGAI